MNYLREKYRKQKETKRRRGQHISPYERGKASFSSDTLLAALFV
jgi:hypothetical protein